MPPANDKFGITAAALTPRETSYADTKGSTHVAGI